MSLAENAADLAMAQISINQFMFNTFKSGTTAMIGCLCFDFGLIPMRSLRRRR